jgi:S1-C subfamily serine protease
MMVGQTLESRRAWLVLACVVLLGTAGIASAQTRSGHVVQLLDRVGGGNWATEGSTIGIEVDDVAANDATEEGAFVNAVREGSPAESAGFAEGDVVVGFDGERVRGVRQLTRLVRETPEGRTVSATVLRDGSRVELQVTPESGRSTTTHMSDRLLSRGLDGYDAPNFTFDIPQLPGRPRLGVTVQRLSSQLADYFGVAEGLLVSNVDEGSVAAEAGVMAGDVITALDGRAVDSTDSLRRRLSAVDAGEEVSIGVTRGGRELSLTATLPDTRPRAHRYQFFGEDDSTLE